MSDPEETFREAVRGAIRRLQRTRGSAREISTDRKSVRGWRATYLRSDGPFRDGTWQESRGVYLVVGEDGSLWELWETRYEEQESPWEIKTNQSLWEISTNVLVGSRGGPFSEWKARIDRLGY